MYNKIFIKSVLFIALLLILIFHPQSVFAAAVAIQGPVVTPMTIPAGQTSTLNYNFTLTGSESAIKVECSGILETGNITWVLSGAGLYVSEDINASDFLATGQVSKRGTFSVNPTSYGSTTSYPVKVGVYCEQRLAGTGSKITESAPVVINVSGGTAGVVSVNFNTLPRSVQPSSDVNFIFTVAAQGKATDVDNVCPGDQSGSLVYRIFMFPAAGRDDFSSPVNSGAITISQLGNGTTPVTRNFNQTIRSLDRDFVFKTRLMCTDDRVLTTSSAVTITSGGAGGGTCNRNNICEPNLGETSATCSDCPIVPGATQSFQFSITNPLQATNLVELINVIATWIFNLAIPVAVAMIVYAGVLFLISKGDTAKVTQAKKILLYTVLGLAIILIGKGFITLIESILNLGGTP